VSWLRAQPLNGRVFPLIEALVRGGGLFMAALANGQPGHLHHAAGNLASPKTAPTASEPSPFLSTPAATTPTPTHHSPLQVSITGGRQLWTAQGSGSGRSGGRPRAARIRRICVELLLQPAEQHLYRHRHRGRRSHRSGRLWQRPPGRGDGHVRHLAPFMVAILAPATCTWYAGANG
jgi:hypothetical protein